VVTSTGDGPWVSAPAKNARAATASRRSETRTSTAYPDEVIGIHLMAVGAPQHLDPATLTEEEQEYLRRVEAWDREEGAYMHQQSTRPRTLSYGLSDSPVGLLASILEKYHAWSDCAGDVSSRFSADFLLTQASLYWFTNTAGTRPSLDQLRRECAPRSAAPSSGRFPTSTALRRCHKRGLRSISPLAGIGPSRPTRSAAGSSPKAPLLSPPHQSHSP
jgi:hypothetical protein